VGIVAVKIAGDEPIRSRASAGQYTSRPLAMSVARHDPLLAAFAALVARRESAPIVASAEACWSLGELDRAARALAERLAGEGFGEGDAIGLAAAPGPAFLAGYLALRRRGAVPVLCDSARPTADRLAALDRLGVRGFLAAGTGWPESAREWDLDRRAPERELVADRAWGAIKLTSGSTGEPRGVAVRAEALAADDAQLVATMGVRADDRLLAAVPLSHSYGFSSLLLPALGRGSLLVVPADRSPFAPLAAARALDATIFPTVPAWLAGYVRLAVPPPWPESLRLTLAAGAPLAPETALRFRERTGRAVHVFYGASECGGIAYDREGRAAERGSVGTSVDGVTLEIDGACGRLRVRSAAAAESYLPEPAPELAAGAFLTGDLAEIDATGEVRLLGRADDLVIVRGKNVDPREIEAVLRTLPGVEEAMVFGVDGPEGRRSVLRAVVAAPAGQVDYARVTAFCRSRLAEHKIPRSLLVLPELPRTARGKPDRAALATLVCAADD
jgi:long-chain acyl-CoA synthetase